MSTDLAQLPLHALAAKLKSRSVSPVDIVDTCLERIAKLDPKLHAFVEVYETEARLRGGGGRQGHPLAATPSGRCTAFRSRSRICRARRPRGHRRHEVWRERRSTRTATLAQKLISAGMIVIGKTHTVEFAFGGWGTNQHLGTPWNPWDAKTPSHARRLQQRLGRGGRGAHGALRHRHRYRRLGALAGRVVRHHRA